MYSLELFWLTELGLFIHANVAKRILGERIRGKTQIL